MNNGSITLRKYIHKSFACQIKLLARLRISCIRSSIRILKTKLTANKGVVSVKVSQSTVTVTLSRGYPIRTATAELARRVQKALTGIDLGARDLEVVVNQNIVSHSAQQGAQLVPGIKNIIAVASGKGGVGKSTCSANLALALAAEGAKVGMLDADIYGPSQPRMLGITGKPNALENKMLLPMISHNIKIMSIGFFGRRGYADDLAWSDGDPSSGTDAAWHSLE